MIWGSWSYPVGIPSSFTALEPFPCTSEVITSFPEASICFTWISFTPYVSSGSINELPVPVNHVFPPSSEYFHVFPTSIPVTSTSPLLVYPSIELIPVSVFNVRLKVAGGIVSIDTW